MSSLSDDDRFTKVTSACPKSCTNERPHCIVGGFEFEMRGENTNRIEETAFLRRALGPGGWMFALHVLVSTLMNGYGVTSCYLVKGIPTAWKCRTRSVNVSVGHSSFLTHICIE